MDAVSHWLSACHYLLDYVGAAMTWIKLDDGFPTNPKILPLSDAAFRLYIEGLCYSGKYLTDGFLNEAIVRRLGDPTELVEAGIWESIEGGFQILNYTEYQTPKAEVEKKREQGRERLARFKEKRVSNALETLPDNRVQNTDNINKYSPSFDDFWNAYPLKVGKGAARKAWLKAVTKAEPSLIIEGVKRYANDPNRDPAYTAHAATWLNAERWTDSELPPRSPVSGFKPITTPTWTPPRFTASETAQGVPMPETARQILDEIRRGT